jgi:hypothetical protein
MKSEGDDDEPDGGEMMSSRLSSVMGTHGLDVELELAVSMTALAIISSLSVSTPDISHGPTHWLGTYLDRLAGRHSPHRYFP